MTKASITRSQSIVLCLALLAVGCDQYDGSVKLKPLADGYLAAWNTGNFEELDKIVNNDFELRMSPGYEPLRGIDSLKTSIANLRRAYPDLVLATDEIIYGQETIVVRWTIRATNTGPGSHPPTGKAIVVPGMSILHVKNGKIVDEWIAANNLLWMQQLGAI